MKWIGKYAIVLAAAVALVTTVSCAGGDSGETVSKADFDAVQSQLEATKMELEDAKSATPSGSRLAAVKERGTLICASRNDVPGYGSVDESGRNVGFDIDLCRAIAAAVLGDPDAIEIRLITAAERGPTIQSGRG